jgi:hypothetical protein
MNRVCSRGVVMSISFQHGTIMTNDACTDREGFQGAFWLATASPGHTATPTVTCPMIRDRYQWMSELIRTVLPLAL